MVSIHEGISNAERKGCSTPVFFLGLLSIVTMTYGAEDALLEASLRVEPLRACPQTILEIQDLQAARLELIDSYHRVVRSFEPASGKLGSVCHTHRPNDASTLQASSCCCPQAFNSYSDV